MTIWNYVFTFFVYCVVFLLGYRVGMAQRSRHGFQCSVEQRGGRVVRIVLPHQHPVVRTVVEMLLHPVHDTPGELDHEIHRSPTPASRDVPCGCGGGCKCKTETSDAHSAPGAI